MKVIEQTSNWILYSDGQTYVLDARCNYGIAEPTATFKLLEDEINHYLAYGNDIIHDLAAKASNSSSKYYYEQQRPISLKIKKSIDDAKK